MNSDRFEIAHIMRRAGFGATPAELDALTREIVEVFVLIHQAGCTNVPKQLVYGIPADITNSGRGPEAIPLHEEMEDLCSFLDT